MKKLLSYVLSIVLLISLISTSLIQVGAASNSSENTNVKTAQNETLAFLSYSKYGDKIKIIGCNKKASGDLIIPDTIEGLPVTNISSYAFKDCANLTSVTVPNSVVEIGNAAFSGCSALEQLTLPFIGHYKNPDFSNSTQTNASDVLFGYIFGEQSYTSSIGVEQCYGIYDSSGNLYEKKGSNTYRYEYWGNGSHSSGQKVCNYNYYPTIVYSSYNYCSAHDNTVESRINSLKKGAVDYYTVITSDSTAPTSNNRILGFSAGHIADGYRKIYYIPSTLKKVTVTNCDRLYYGSFSFCTNLEQIIILDADCKIDINAFYNCNSETVLCSKGSTLEKYIINGYFKYCSFWSNGGVGVSSSLKGKYIPPEKPSVQYVTDTYIELTENSFYEYSINGTTWQKSNRFDNLKPNTDYIFYQRIAATNENVASDSSQGITVTTFGEAPLAPTAPTTEKIGSTEITLTSHFGYEYRCDNGSWQKSNVFTGLKPNTNYTFYQRIAASNLNLASDSSDGITVKTPKNLISTPKAPDAERIDYESVVLVPRSGYEYRRDNGSWQKSNVFTGLKPNTFYTFYQRVAETETSYASSQSAGVSIMTNPSFTIDGEFLGGNGTEQDPYMIASKVHLNNVRNHLDAHYIMMADIQFSTSDFEEGGDFYNDGKGWEPIGNSRDLPFTGVFDGNGYVIRGLQINATDSVYVGLFGYSMGKILSLGLEQSNIKATSSNVVYVGGIVGEVGNLGPVTNCYNTGKITAVSTGSNLYGCYAGGITGGGGDITECYNTGYIDSSAYVSDSSTTYRANVYAGGISGAGLTIKNCYNTGTIYAYSGGSVYVRGGSAYAGGISATNSFDIQNCYNVGEVGVSSGGSGSSLHYGGIVALGESTGSYSIQVGATSVGSSDGTVCSKDEMKQQETFAAFDFMNVWEIDNYNNYSYPQLKHTRQETIEKIEIVMPPDNTQFVEGKYPDLTGATVKITYKSKSYQSPKIVSVAATLQMLSELDINRTGTQKIHLSYGGQSTAETITFEVLPKPIASVAVTTLPHKTTYVQGQPLNPEGGELTIYYNDDTSKTVALSKAQLSYPLSQTGIVTVTVQYLDFITDFNITINEKQIKYIQLTEPTKLLYHEGEELNLTNGQLYVTYISEDNYTENIPLEQTIIDNYDSYQLGKQILRVNYQGKTITFTITVKGDLPAPAAPELSAKTDTYVTLIKVTGYEYSMDGLHWQDNPTFTRLHADMVYCFYQRVKETDTHYASPSSTALTVKTNAEYIVGDLNKDNTVTDADAIYLLMHTFFSEDYPVNQSCDFNSDGGVTDADAIYLLMYTFFPEDYPIKKE